MMMVIIIGMMMMMMILMLVLLPPLLVVLVIVVVVVVVIVVGCGVSSDRLRACERVSSGGGDWGEGADGDSDDCSAAKQAPHIDQTSFLTPCVPQLKPLHHKAAPADGPPRQGSGAARAQITKPQLVVSEDLPWAVKLYRIGISTISFSSPFHSCCGYGAVCSKPEPSN